MILYLDTSSLIKLYVEESGSRDVESLVAEASFICTSVIAYPEARSALARLSREGNLTAEEHALSKANLEEDWPGYFVLEVTADIWRAAGDLTEKYALRGFDSSTVSTSHHSSTWPVEASVSRSDYPRTTAA